MALCGCRPVRPSAVTNECSRMPAFSSVVVGAAMLAMVVTQATRVFPSLTMSGI
jgi:hypothetical protein